MAEFNKKKRPWGLYLTLFQLQNLPPSCHKGRQRFKSAWLHIDLLLKEINTDNIKIIYLKKFYKFFGKGSILLWLDLNFSFKVVTFVDG